MLALAGIALVAAFLAGLQIPFVTSDRRAFAALAILGWIGCSVAVGPAIQAVGWRDPTIWAAAALGVCALALVAIVALDRTQVLGSLADAAGIRATGNRIALILFVAILFAKTLLTVTTRSR